MKTDTTQSRSCPWILSVVLAISAAGFVPAANAELLSASAGGTFTMNMDKDVFLIRWGRWVIYK